MNGAVAASHVIEVYNFATGLVHHRVVTVIVHMSRTEAVILKIAQASTNVTIY